MGVPGTATPLVVRIFLDFESETGDPERELGSRMQLKATRLATRPNLGRGILGDHFRKFASIRMHRHCFTLDRDLGPPITHRRIS